MYRLLIWEEDHCFNDLYTKFFNSNLKRSVKIKKIRVRGKTQHWYEIQWKRWLVKWEWYFEIERSFNENPINI